MFIPKDIPKTIQQTFIMYSKLSRDGSEQLIIPSAITVWQSAAFTCATGFKEVSGSYSSSVVDITPEINDGVLSFEVIGKQQGAYHSGYFVLTLTTNGETEMSEEEEAEIVKIESVTMDFTVRVIVYGKADLLGSNQNRTYYVGNYIEPFSVVPQTINPIIDYGGTSGSLKDVTQQYDSGLYFTHVQDPIQFKTVDIKMGGTATRPGVYLAWIFANQWTEGGQYDNLPSTFDRGNNAAPLIVTILDHDHAEGNLMVNAPATVTAANVYRVVWLSETVEAFASSEYLYNCEMGRASDTLWSGSYVDDKDYYTITYQYQLRDEGGAWVLEGREIDSRAEGEPPTFDVYDTSDYRIEMQENPHVYGWNEVIIQGLTDFYMKARDIRGMDEQEAAEVPYQDYGFFNKIATGVWEQQIQYTPQYEGLVTAEERQFDDGKIYSELEELEGDFFEWDVQKIAIAQTVSPYAPPATEYYGTTSVRDVALTVGGTMHSLNGEKEDGVVVPAGKRWKYWPGARRITPKNGTSGDIVATETMGCSYSHVISHDYYKNQYYDTPQPQVGESTITESNMSWSGEFSLDKGQERNADTIWLAIGMIVGDSNLSRMYTSTTSQWQTADGYEYSDTTEVTQENNGDGVSLSQGVFYVASGPFSGLCKHEAVATGWAGVYIDGTEDVHTVRTIIQTGQPTSVTTTDTTSPLNQSAYYLANSLSVVSGDAITIVGYKRITKILSATSSKAYQYEYMDDPWSESGGGTCEATHSSVQEIINGVNIGSGTTYSKFVIDGVITEETVSDTDGSIYASLLDSFVDIEIPPPKPGLIYATFNKLYNTYSDVETIEFA